MIDDNLDGFARGVPPDDPGARLLICKAVLLAGAHLKGHGTREGRRTRVVHQDLLHEEVLVRQDEVYNLLELAYHLDRLAEAVLVRVSLAHLGPLGSLQEALEAIEHEVRRAFELAQDYYDVVSRGRAVARHR